ncbi:MAG: type III pantothenate kinase [Bacillota bacterium]|nr:type III pantothenate kinase [Bacillota bacterium]
MLLVVNIGNTNITVAVYSGERPLVCGRLHTDIRRTADEYAIVLDGLMARHGLEPGQVESVAVCSVVPELIPVFAAVARDQLMADALTIGPGLALGIELGYEDPGELGADRIADAEAAYSRYGGPVIAVDLGTATTVNAVTAAGLFAGGAIAPGIGIASEALFQRAVRLPRIELSVPPNAIGRSTADGLRSGIVFGFAGQVDALVTRVAGELGGHPTVVATGGLAHVVSQVSRTIEHVDPLLTLEGIRLIHDRNRGRRDGACSRGVQAQ